MHCLLRFTYSINHSLNCRITPLFFLVLFYDKDEYSITYLNWPLFNPDPSVVWRTCMIFSFLIYLLKSVLSRNLSIPANYTSPGNIWFRQVILYLLWSRYFYCLFVWVSREWSGPRLVSAIGLYIPMFPVDYSLKLCYSIAVFQLLLNCYSHIVYYKWYLHIMYKH